MLSLRWCLLAVFAILVTTVLFAAAPPPTPDARNRFAQKGSGVTGKLYTHDEAVQISAADLKTFAPLTPKEELYYYRYISLHIYPDNVRKEKFADLVFVLNSLSRSTTLVTPAYNGVVARVNLADYHIDPKAWDRL